MYRIFLLIHVLVQCTLQNSYYYYNILLRLQVEWKIHGNLQIFRNRNTFSEKGDNIPVGRIRPAGGVGGNTRVAAFADRPSANVTLPRRSNTRRPWGRGRLSGTRKGRTNCPLFGAPYVAPAPTTPSKRVLRRSELPLGLHKLGRNRCIQLFSTHLIFSEKQHRSSYN